MTLIVVAHEVGFAREIADRMVSMADGTIVEENRADEFFGKPRGQRTKQFLGRILHW
jgi:ABC-type polar amino acid transport system ATPase subunit